MGEWIWLPRWVTAEARERVAQGTRCNCQAFCAFYESGDGPQTPRWGEICPVYFIDRPEIFECTSREGALDFTYLPWDVPQLRSALIRFGNREIFFEFGWGSGIPGDYWLEHFVLDLAGRGMHVRLPRGLLRAAFDEPQTDVWTELGNKLNLLLLSGVSSSQ